jgi:uncharacterized repeat protein (TIGR03803 family)
MTNLSVRKMAAIFLFSAAAVITSSAQVFTNLVNFDSTNGAEPNSSLVQGLDGSLYGTTVNGGSSYGIVFKITRSGELTTVYTFCSQGGCADGSFPVSGLVLATDGDFYGTTQLGGANGAGTVFKVTSTGILSTLHAFEWNDGAEPQGALVQASDGNFYGTTLYGGSGQCQNQFGFGCGTVFRVTPSGKLTMLHSFDLSDGAFPYGTLVQASDGNLYGTTQQGGPANGGTVFRVTTRGTLKTIYNFCSLVNCADGAGPIAPLVQGLDGSLYGAAAVRGANSNGTIFKITSEGKLTILHSFDGADGGGPTALVQATDGNFYGTTSEGGDLTCNGSLGCGTFFKVTPGGTLTTLHDFELTDGALPYGSPVQATNGVFYGTTAIGGTSNVCFDGCGTAFSMSTGLGAFVSFVRNPAKVGQMFGVLGQGFTGTTSVSLNGAAAKFVAKSNTLLVATVPLGATTGYVTVTTPSGTLTSNVPFHVIP